MRWTSRKGSASLSTGCVSMIKNGFDCGSHARDATSMSQRHYLHVHDRRCSFIYEI